MEQQDKRLENLHQQASTLYLQGEYVAALEAWRQLLRVQPDDERALEGVRLCELLVQEEIGSLPPPSASPAPGDQAQAAEFGIGEDLDEDLDELDEMLGEAGDTDWMDKPPAETPQSPAAQPAEADGIGFDLSDEGEQNSARVSDNDFNLDGADRRPEASTASEIDAAFDFEAPESPAPPQGPAPGNTAHELQKRADELMAEALEHYENGQRSEALSVLDRLAILDENNEAARTFANHIRTELEASSGAASPEPAVRTDPRMTEADTEMTFEPPTAEEELLGEPPVVEPTPPVPPAASPPPAPPPPQVEHGVIDLGATEGESLSLGGADRTEAVASENPDIGAAAPGQDFDLCEAVIGDESAKATSGAAPASAAPAKARRPTNRWLLIAAMVLLLLGGGYVALQFLGGGAEPPDAETTALAGPPPLVAPVDAGGSAPKPQPAADPPPQTAPPVPAGELDEILDRGDAAYEDGDYAAAVLAYNEALKLDPQNEVARRRLEEAGDLYREQKQQLEQRAQAIQAFNDGDYRNALRIFYRLAAADEAEARRFERYKFNGWYNMGVRALKSGDCRLARSNLREAQQVNPTDPGLQYAMELSGRCFEDQSEGFFDATRALRLRTLDD